MSCVKVHLNNRDNFFFAYSRCCGDAIQLPVGTYCHEFSLWCVIIMYVYVFMCVCVYVSVCEWIFSLIFFLLAMVTHNRQRSQSYIQLSSYYNYCSSVAIYLFVFLYIVFLFSCILFFCCFWAQNNLISENRVGVLLYVALLDLQNEWISYNYIHKYISIYISFLN